MHCTLVPIGSRGDVQPFVSLGARLRRAGHAVRVATHEPFAAMITEAGLDFVSIGGNPQELLDELVPRTMSQNPFDSVPAILDLLAGLITPTLRGVAQVIADPTRPTDAVIASYPALFAAIEAADQRRVPIVLASLHPVSPSRQLHSLLLPPAPAGCPRPGPGATTSGPTEWARRSFSAWCIAPSTARGVASSAGDRVPSRRSAPCTDASCPFCTR